MGLPAKENLMEEEILPSTRTSGVPSRRTRRVREGEDFQAVAELSCNSECPNSECPMAQAELGDALGTAPDHATIGEEEIVSELIAPLSAPA